MEAWPLAVVTAVVLVAWLTASLAAVFWASVRSVRASIDERAVFLALANTVSPSRPFVAAVNLVTASVTAMLSLVSVVPSAIAFAVVKALSRVDWFVASL